MGFPAGERRDFEALEQRRMQAARLLKKGFSQSEVARQVGAHRQSVSQWAAELSEHGRAGLKKAGRAGRKPLLSKQDRRHIVAGLKRGPQALGYETSLWTSARVAHLIERECGVEYHPGHAWRILRQLNQVDVTSLHFHGARPISISVVDVNHDGIPDLLLEFPSADVQLSPHATRAQLTG